MNKRDRGKIERDIIKFCYFPVPKTPIDIVRYVKYNNPYFYTKTPDKQVVKFLRANFLNSLVDKGILVKYTPDLKEWKKIRKFMSFYENKEKKKKTRKVNELYQINFFQMGKNDLLIKTPVLVESNLDLVVLFYNLAKDKKEIQTKNFTLELINLMKAYSESEKIRDKIKIAIYNSELNERQIDSFEKILEYSFLLKNFLNSIPLKTDEEKAFEFISNLVQ